MLRAYKRAQDLKLTPTMASIAVLLGIMVGFLFP
jgi:hypothetical protein